MREEGITVDRSTDPWTISAPAVNVFADRDFSVQDFIQAFAARTQVAKAQCSDSTLTPQSPIMSEAAAGSTSDLSVDVDGVKISATGATESGIDQVHHGEGDITVNVRSSCVETTGTSDTGGEDAASGVLASSESFTNPATNEGAVKIDVRDSTIMTAGPRAKGIVGGHTHTGGIDIDASNTNITTTGERATGIYGQYTTSTGGTGDITIDATDVTISTGGNRAGGIWGLHTRSEGDLSINVRGGSITTIGNHSEAFGIKGTHEGDSGTLTITAREGFTIDTHGNQARGIWGERGYAGTPLPSGNPGDDLIIKLSDGEITTRGYWGDAIYANHRGPGMIDIDLENVTIETRNTALDPTHSLAISRGILAVHRSTGDIDVNVRGGSIRTLGPDSYGIDARNLNTGSDAASKVRVTTLNTPITTWGARSSGIYARHYSSNAGRSIAIDAKGDIHAIGTGASGVKVGNLNSDGEVIDAGGLDAEGYRKQTVTVNGRVIGNAAGVYLAGGGRVVIGPQGSVGAASGIAILATGDTPAADPLDTPIKPKLYLDMKLAGRRVAQVIGNNWIINDGGETTIAVNNIILHEGATGVVPDAVAPNGAWNVTMREHGVKVDDSTADRVNWTFTQSIDDDKIIKDRDFSTQDFTETARPRPPPPSMCPAGQVGTPPDCTDAETEMPTEMQPTGPMFMEEYAPRAAVYEVLPDFLLRMQNWAPTRQHLLLPKSPTWIRLLGSTGSQEFKHSSVNADYDADRFAVEAGAKLSLSEDFNLWATLHHVTGSAQVSSPVHGGDIDVQGTGLSVNAYWNHEHNYYAAGHVSLTSYDLDLSSHTIGRLKSNIDASGHAVHLEAGRRMPLGEEHLHWTPRAWLDHTRVSVDTFTDVVESRVSFSNVARLTGGLGVLVESLHPRSGGELSLRGALDVEQKFGDSKTVTWVSGERLRAEPEQSSMLLGLGATLHQGPFRYSAQLSAREELHSGGAGVFSFHQCGYVFLEHWLLEVNKSQRARDEAIQVNSAGCKDGGLNPTQTWTLALRCRRIKADAVFTD